MMAFEDRVLIVGAGPVGLFLANGLAANNIPFTIIDKKKGLSDSSKGLAINVSSLLGFRALLSDKLVVGDTGCKIQRLDVYWKNSRFSSINFSHLQVKDNHLITQPQWVTEKELDKGLDTYNQKVKWEHELLKITNLKDGVAAEIQHNGEIKEDKYTYIVGCDGKHSKVRPFIDTEYTKNEYDMYFVLGDYHLEGNLPRGEVQYRVFKDQFFILVPVSDSITRVVVKYNGTPPDRPVSSDDIKNVVNELIGFPLIESEPVWLSRAPFYNAVAGKMQNDRLFIAGDAAHLYSPIGGTGMNTGFSDIQNLLWRLVYTIKGYVNKAVLDGFSEERCPANLAGSIAVDRSTRFISDIEIDGEFIESISPKMKNRAMLRNILPKIYAGYTFEYKGTDKSKEQGQSEAKRYDAKLTETLLDIKSGMPKPETGLSTTLVLHLNTPQKITDEDVEEFLDLTTSCEYFDVIVLCEEKIIIENKKKNIHSIQDSQRFLRKQLKADITLIRPDFVIEKEWSLGEIENATNYISIEYRISNDIVVN